MWFWMRAVVALFQPESVAGVGSPLVGGCEGCLDRVLQGSGEAVLRDDLAEDLLGDVSGDRCAAVCREVMPSV
jgi:hypothetical protein